MPAQQWQTTQRAGPVVLAHIVRVLAGVILGELAIVAPLAALGARFIVICRSFAAHGDKLFWLAAQASTWRDTFLTANGNAMLWCGWIPCLAKGHKALHTAAA